MDRYVLSATFLMRNLNRDFAFICELDGITHEICQDLTESAGVATNYWLQVAGEEKTELEVFLVRAVSQ
ncbi:MAG: hypothetical protein ACPGPC_15935 [Alphaproteobacteria bacterium]